MIKDIIPVLLKNNKSKIDSRFFNNIIWLHNINTDEANNIIMKCIHDYNNDDNPLSFFEISPSFTLYGKGIDKTSNDVVMKRLTEMIEFYKLYDSILDYEKKNSSYYYYISKIGAYDYDSLTALIEAYKNTLKPDFIDSITTDDMNKLTNFIEKQEMYYRLDNDRIKINPLIENPIPLSDELKRAIKILLDDNRLLQLYLYVFRSKVFNGKSFYADKTISNSIIKNALKITAKDILNGYTTEYCIESFESNLTNNK